MRFCKKKFPQNIPFFSITLDENYSKIRDALNKS